MLEDGSNIREGQRDQQCPSLLHPLPLPLGGLVAIGYQTIVYYNKDVQHAIDPPTVKVHP